jgi:hypothetical protein
MAEPKHYYLEIYEEGNADTPCCEVASDFPFLAIAVGDELNPRTLPYWAAEKPRTSSSLTITRVEHSVSAVDNNVRHTVCLYSRYA